MRVAPPGGTPGHLSGWPTDSAEIPLLSQATESGLSSLMNGFRMDKYLRRSKKDYYSKEETPVKSQENVAKMKVEVLLVSCLLLSGVCGFTEKRDARAKRAELEITADGKLGDHPPSREEIEEALLKSAAVIDEALEGVEDPSNAIEGGSEGKRGTELTISERAAEQASAADTEVDAESVAARRMKRGWRVRIRVSFSKKRK